MTARTVRIEVKLTDDDENAILWSLGLDDEETAWRRRGICREYLQNKVAEMLRLLRASAANGENP